MSIDSLPSDIFVPLPPPRVLAIDLFSRGVAFTLVEPGPRLLDWGLKYTRRNAHSSDTSLKEITALLEENAPTVVVLEDITSATRLRNIRVAQLLREIDILLAYRYPNIKVVSISRAAIRQVFELNTKDAIASALAQRFPEVSHRLPPARKMWMAEDERINIFDALAMATVWMHLNKEKVEA